MLDFEAKLVAKGILPSSVKLLAANLTWSQSRDAIHRAAKQRSSRIAKPTCA